MHFSKSTLFEQVGYMFTPDVGTGVVVDVVVVVVIVGVVDVVGVVEVNV